MARIPKAPKKPKTPKTQLSAKQQYKLAKLGIKADIFKAKNSGNSRVQMVKSIANNISATAASISASRAAERITTNSAEKQALQEYLNAIKGYPDKQGNNGSSSTTQVGGSGSALGG